MRGQAEFEIAGRGGRVDVLHGCLVPGGDVHFYEGIGENAHIVIDVPNEDVSTNMERLFDAPRYFEADAGLRLLLAYIQREASTWSLYPEAATGLTQGLMGALHHRMFDRPCAPVRGKLDLALLEAYVHKHLNEPLPVSRLAAVAHVSVGHFHLLFRDATGMTPYQYLLEARLRRARELLVQTPMPLAEIAGQVGFSSQSALTHAFRRFYGEPPGRLRRLH